jgi:hypothetical protein
VLLNESPRSVAEMQTAAVSKETTFLKVECGIWDARYIN